MESHADEMRARASSLNDDTLAAARGKKKRHKGGGDSGLLGIAHSIIDFGLAGQSIYASRFVRSLVCVVCLSVCLC